MNLLMIIDKDPAERKKGRGRRKRWKQWFNSGGVVGGCELNAAIPTPPLTFEVNRLFPGQREKPFTYLVFMSLVKRWSWRLREWRLAAPSASHYILKEAIQVGYNSCLAWLLLHRRTAPRPLRKSQRVLFSGAAAPWPQTDSKIQTAAWVTHGLIAAC